MIERRRIIFVLVLTFVFGAVFYHFYRIRQIPIAAKLLVENSDQSQALLDLRDVPDAIKTSFTSHPNAYQDKAPPAQSARAVPFIHVLNHLHINPEEVWIEIDSGNGFKTYVDADYIRRFKPILYFEIDGRPIDGSSAHYGSFPMGPFLFYPTDLSLRKQLDGGPEEVFYQWNVVKIRFLKKSEAAQLVRWMKSDTTAYFVMSFCNHCHSAGPWGGHVSALQFSDLQKIARTDPRRCTASIDSLALPNGAIRMEQRSYWSAKLKKDICEYFARWSWSQTQ